MELIEKIKQLCEGLAGEVTCFTEDFCPNDYAGGNFDDAWSGGMNDGVTHLANQILELIAKESNE